MKEKVKTNAGIEVYNITEEEYEQIDKENTEIIEHYGWAEMCLFCGFSDRDDLAIQFGNSSNKILQFCSKHKRYVISNKICPDFKN